jgi:hypothetical protein
LDVKKGFLVLAFLLLPSIVFGQSKDEQAKNAFAQVKLDSIAKSAFESVKLHCECQNCDCKDCKCTKDTCDCISCNSFDAVYKKAIKDNQAVVLAVSAPKIESPMWKLIELKTITGEKPGYIVGVPKDGALVRLDFPPTATKQRIRLDILHVYYPLTAGYQECATCPYGRVWVGVQKTSSLRNPVGHTHTCTSCGETWDHTANPTHTCTNCGGHPPMTRNGGYLADVAPRMIRSR